MCVNNYHSQFDTHPTILLIGKGGKSRPLQLKLTRNSNAWDMKWTLSLSIRQRRCQCHSNFRQQTTLKTARAATRAARVIHLSDFAHRLKQLSFGIQRYSVSLFPSLWAKVAHKGVIVTTLEVHNFTRSVACTTFKLVLMKLSRYSSSNNASSQT
jgi:hypothetical protein